VKFREFTINNHSTREYLNKRLEKNEIDDIREYLSEINHTIGKDNGFSFILMEDGDKIFDKLDGYGGYCGYMIKAPYYIGLRIDKKDHVTQFKSAYYMQNIIYKLYQMDIGSCWVALENLPEKKIKELIKDQPGTIEYLLAFGKAKVREKKNLQIFTNRTSKYEEDPYGITMIKTEDSRNSVMDTVYLYKWGTVAPFLQMERRGLLDVLYYVRNSPSYENSQPCRLILNDGYMDLAIIDPKKNENYTNAGIMMYMLHGLAKELGFPSKWKFIEDCNVEKDYRIVGRIEL
jgi:hypothetical protein